MTKKEKAEKDLVKYEMAAELGLLDKVKERGWGGLTAAEAGKIGGLLSGRRRKAKDGGNPGGGE